MRSYDYHCYHYYFQTHSIPSLLVVGRQLQEKVPITVSATGQPVQLNDCSYLDLGGNYVDVDDGDESSVLQTMPLIHQSEAAQT